MTTCLSAGVSLFLIGMLIQAFAGSAGAELLPRLVRTLREVSIRFLAVYAFCGFLQAGFRALRYRLILASGDDPVPGFAHLFLVTVSRNMFVDLLPARLGELSFIAMLNRGYRIHADICLAALSISFVFDLLALGVLLVLVFVYQLVKRVQEPWMIGGIIMIFLVAAILLIILFPGLRRLASELERRRVGDVRYIGWIARLTITTAAALQKAAQSGIAGRLMLLSLGVRGCKYIGLYVLFLAIVIPGFAAVKTDIGSVFVTLISAEAGASMPIPAFMSFGTYEAGGAMAMISLGADKTGSLLIMLALHLWSQVVDYAMGISALVAFFFVVARRAMYSAVPRPLGGRAWLWAVGMLCIGLLFLAFQVRGLKKIGSFSPPRPGHALGVPATVTVQEKLKQYTGFVVWSSNRSGNHDILRMSLPDRTVTPLTTHPHSESYPRISPDGRWLLFARSHEPYVSVRNPLPWEVIMLDLETGVERSISKQGNMATWSADGTKIRFQRHGNQFVEHDLTTGRETILLESGKTIGVPASAQLETPVFSDARQALAVTLRGGVRGTFVINMKGQLRPVGQGCELAWSPDSSYLYYVDHGGSMMNAFYRVDPETLQRKLWFDSPTEYSHEYFPKVSNTGDILAYGASTGDHEHDRADYEIFLWAIGTPPADAVRLTYHTGNDNWPDIYLVGPGGR